MVYNRILNVNIVDYISCNFNQNTDCFMKRFLPVTIPLFFFLSTALAQKETPAFGKVEMADLQMTECSFDKAAEAVVLFDVAEVYCFFNINSMTNILSSQMERHVRIKILKTSGLDFANVRIRFISEKNIEEIKGLTAETINLDASGQVVVSKVDKKNIYLKKVDKRISELSFAFPDVRPGSVIEYKYRNDASDLYATKFWYFQRNIPVRYSRYVLDFPVELSITAQPLGGLPVSMKQVAEGNRNIKTFTMTEVPALRDEPFISCEEDYLQRVIPFMVSLDIPGQLRKNLVRTWPGIVKELMEDDDFGVQLKKNIPRTSDLDAMLAPVSDPYRKMVIIHEYVRKNMQWNELYGIWALEGVKAAWRDKKGTTGEINLILVNLLKDAGLDASPILLSTRENGRINTTVAGYEQFNKVMALVKTRDDVYVLDATNRFCPASLIPLDVLYSEGLVIEKISSENWGWAGLVDEKHSFQTDVNIQGNIDAGGTMNGNALVISKDYARLIRAPLLKAGKEDFIKTYFSNEEPDVKIDSIFFDNEDIDSLPLMQQLSFSRKVSSSGDYNYFSVNMFAGLEKNPFIADTRVSDVFFGAGQQYTINANIMIPEGYVFDGLPKSSRMRLPDTSIVLTRYIETDGQQMLSVRLIIEFKKPMYEVAYYDEFHEFYKKLYAVLNEQFVYRKK